MGALVEKFISETKIASSFLDTEVQGSCRMIGLLWLLSSKDSICSAGDVDSVPLSGRSPGEGNGNPLQYFCLGNPIDRGAWQATAHGVAKGLDTT